jgi:effector-binding domain-containing protein
MKYLLLIYTNESSWTEAEREHCLAESTQLTHELHATGKYLAAAPLHPVATATSVRIREGKRLVTDGPFAETREQLGGYFLIEAADLDEAIAIAARIPGARKGTVEVRPVLDLAGLPETKSCGMRAVKLDSPQVAQTAAQPAAVIRLTIPRAEIRKVMGPGLHEIMAAIAAQGVAPAGPWYTHHLRMDPEIFDFEIGVPVAAPVAAAGRVKPGGLPATRVARTTYHGSYEGLAAAWGQFDAWVAAHGHTPATDLWECYVAGPESSPEPADWRTELYRPLIS